MTKEIKRDIKKINKKIKELNEKRALLNDELYDVEKTIEILKDKKLKYETMLETGKSKVKIIDATLSIWTGKDEHEQQIFGDIIAIEINEFNIIANFAAEGEDEIPVNILNTLKTRKYDKVRLTVISMYQKPEEFSDWTEETKRNILTKEAFLKLISKGSIKLRTIDKWDAYF